MHLLGHVWVCVDDCNTSVLSVSGAEDGVIGGWLWGWKLYFPSSGRGSRYLHLCLWLLSTRCWVCEGKSEQVVFFLTLKPTPGQLFSNFRMMHIYKLMHSAFSYDYSLWLQQNALYCTERCLAFQCDLTKDDLQATIQVETVDVATLIFVLSAIHPDKMQKALEQMYKVLLITCCKTETLSQCINVFIKHG